MKRSCKTVCALFLLVGLCSALAVVSAQTDPDALAIREISITHDLEDTVLRMTFQNDGNAGIDEFGIALAFLDANGMRVFGYADTLEGYENEVCNWYYTPEETMAYGDTYETEDVFQAYASATDIGVAIRYYHYSGGEYILIPESEWVWLSPGYETSTVIDRNYYIAPSDALYAQIDDYDPGYHSYLLDDYNAAYYGKNQGGEWIISVEEGSAAANAGLEAGDLILFADAIKPTENVYAAVYATADLLSGENVDWVFERDGTVYVTRLSNPN
jgi:hypothetical protein